MLSANQNWGIFSCVLLVSNFFKCHKNSGLRPVENQSNREKLTRFRCKISADTVISFGVEFFYRRNGKPVESHYNDLFKIEVSFELRAVILIMHQPHSCSFVVLIIN